MPQRFAPRHEAIWRAGLELGVLHLGVWMLSLLVPARILPSLLPLARPLRAMAEWFRPFGSSRGGMVATVQGLDVSGRGVTAIWALVASANDGPHIPILPALAIVRALAEGRLKKTGAMPCAGVVTLSDIAREFARFHIVMRTMTHPQSVMPRALGKNFDVMPEAIRRGHLVDGVLVLEGRAAIMGAATIFGRALAWLMGFPKGTTDVPVSVEMRADQHGETGRVILAENFQPGLDCRAARPRHRTVRLGDLRLALRASPAASTWRSPVAASARCGCRAAFCRARKLANASMRRDVSASTYRSRFRASASWSTTAAGLFRGRRMPAPACRIPPLRP